MTAELLIKVHLFEELIIGPSFVQALSALKLSGRPSPLFKCKQVVVESPLLKCELPGIACLVRNSAHLETLVIEVVNPDEYYIDHWCLKEIFGPNGLEYNLEMQKGKAVHFKNVKAIDRRNLCLRDQSKWSDIY